MPYVIIQFRRYFFRFKNLLIRKTDIVNYLSIRLKNFYKNKMVKYEPRQALNEEFKLELMNNCKPEVEKLSDFLKKDLVSLWDYDKI